MWQNARRNQSWHRFGDSCHYRSFCPLDTQRYAVPQSRIIVWHALPVNMVQALTVEILWSNFCAN
jgi:hypothetical protein